MIAKIKAHFREHKKKYMTGAGIVGLMGGAYYLGSRQGEGASITQAVYKPRGDVIGVKIELVEYSTPSKPIHLLGSNQYFNSISEAARETGHDRTMLSRHINGQISDLNGDVFEVLQPTA